MRNGLPPLPVFVLTLLLPVAAQPEDRAPRGLPIRYEVGGRVFEVPSGTGRLGWRPETRTELTVELLEPPIPGDDIAEEDLPEEGLGPIPVRLGGYGLKQECFDLWLYGDLPPEKRMVWLLSALSGKIGNLKDRALSPAEVEKLILAGRGDIKRFFDRVEAERPGYEAVRRDLPEGRAFLKAMQPLSIEFRLGLYDFGSLFSKTLGKIENDRARAKPR